MNISRDLMPNLESIGWFRNRGLLGAALLPLGLLFEGLGRLRAVFARPYKSGTPLLCIANGTLGGGGKTPLVAEMAIRAAKLGLKPQVIAHGYRSSLPGGNRITSGSDPNRAGDEAVELAARLAPFKVPVWGGRKRSLSVRAADAVRGTKLLIMDDGLFDPSVAKTFTLLAVDGDYGFGNGWVAPAGPLRRSLSALAKRVDAVAVFSTSDRTLLPNKPHFYAERVLADSSLKKLQRRKTIAFAGISSPSKFFSMVKKATPLVESHGFASHRSPPPQQLARMIATGYQLVTTAKDHARLHPRLKKRIIPLELEIKWRRRPPLALFLQANLPPKRLSPKSLSPKSLS